MSDYDKAIEYGDLLSNIRSAADKLLTERWSKGLCEVDQHDNIDRMIRKAQLCVEILDDITELEKEG